MKTYFLLATCILTGYPAMLFSQQGTRDVSFNIGSGADGAIYATVLQDDGKILIAGEFTSFNGTPMNRIARLNTNGGLDPSFNIGDGASYVIGKMKLQSDGKIIIAGSFVSYNGIPANHIARLNTDGSLDPSFNSGSGTNQSISEIFVQSDDKILVGGNFTEYNGSPASHLMRLNADGGLDPSFDVGSAADGVNTIVEQADGKIIVSGNFTEFNGFPVNYLLRLNSDGSPDAGFSAGAGIDNEVFSLVIQPNQKIIIAGMFLDYNGVQKNRIARINPDGSLDNSFNNIIEPNGPLYVIKAQNDGKLIVGGDFNNMGNFISRLKGTGSADPTFQTGSGANNMVSDLAIQADGKIIVVGAFTTYSGSTAKGIVRLESLNYVPTIITETACDSLVSNSDTYTASGSYIQNLFNTEGYDSIINLNLTINYSNSVIDVQSACDSLTWIDGITYYASTNTPTWTLQNAAGCDSVVTLDLTMIPSVPTIIESTFSLPSDPNSCVGEIAVDISGNPDFELNLDNGAQTATSSGYHVLTNLCPGIHDLQILNSCGDTTTTQFVIPVDSNYVFNNPFIDSLAQDSLGTTLEDCDIYYAGIDSAYIDSIWANGNTVNVIWNIIDSNGSNFDTTSYVLNNGNGVYWLQLSVLCPNKSIGDYFTVTEAIYFENGTVSSAGITELDKWNVQLYPNPTNNLVTISFDGNSAELTIFDAQGKLIKQSGIQSGEQISLKDVQTGVYFFELVTEKGSAVKRVVKN